MMKMSQLKLLTAVDWNDNADFADAQDEMSEGADIFNRKSAVLHQYTADQWNPTVFSVFLYRLF